MMSIIRSNLERSSKTSGSHGKELLPDIANLPPLSTLSTETMDITRIPGGFIFYNEKYGTIFVNSGDVLGEIREWGKT